MPALDMVLRHEGGLETNPQDDGLITNMGISLRFYRKKIKPDATPEDIRNLTIQEVSSIYENQFWNRQPFDEILDQDLANRVFDLHVNTGQGISMLQQAVNIIDLGAHLVIDDMLGYKTLSAVNYLNPTLLYGALISVAENHYKNIVKRHPVDAVFLNGWLARLRD